MCFPILVVIGCATTPDASSTPETGDVRAEQSTEGGRGELGAAGIAEGGRGPAGAAGSGSPDARVSRESPRPAGPAGGTIDTTATNDPPGVVTAQARSDIDAARFARNSSTPVDRSGPGVFSRATPRTVPQRPPATVPSRLQQQRLAYYANNVPVGIRVAGDALADRGAPHLAAAVAGHRRFVAYSQERFVVNIQVRPEGVENGGNFYAAPVVEVSVEDTLVGTRVGDLQAIRLPSTLSRVSVEDAAINSIRRHLERQISPVIQTARRNLAGYLSPGLPVPVSFSGDMDQASRSELARLLAGYGRFAEGVLLSFDVPQALVRKIAEDLEGSRYRLTADELTATLHFGYNTLE